MTITESHIQIQDIRFISPNMILTSLKTIMFFIPILYYLGTLKLSCVYICMCFTCHVKYHGCTHVYIIIFACTCNTMIQVKEKNQRMRR